MKATSASLDFLVILALCAARFPPAFYAVAYTQGFSQGEAVASAATTSAKIYQLIKN